VKSVQKSKDFYTTKAQRTERFFFVNFVIQTRKTLFSWQSFFHHKGHKEHKEKLLCGLGPQDVLKI